MESGYRVSIESTESGYRVVGKVDTKNDKNDNYNMSGKNKKRTKNCSQCYAHSCNLCHGYSCSFAMVIAVVFLWLWLWFMFMAKSCHSYGLCSWLNLAILWFMFMAKSCHSYGLCSWLNLVMVMVVVLL
ncbi:hypothetical protein PIROE2DRAFT_18295 [Piromyces sp. E2]|nr:hypothetical protein PIROE2DRAFT_18295 [Piromyces sp. E2]|eukprot:OUM56889.1 hypothetical protein PIROE2DRAFT_18295 [Piromyces sp. E2]